MTTPPPPGPPSRDPKITAHPEYARSYEHYLSGGSTPEDAARLAYDWTAALEHGTFPPPPPGAAPVRPVKKHRKAKIIGAAVAAGIVGVCVLGVALNHSAPPPATGSKPGGNGVSAQAVEPSPEPSPAMYTPVPKDFTIAVTVLSKQCFGSAGCNLTFRVKPAYSGLPLESSQNFRVLYTVTGDQSGPQTNSFTMAGTDASVTSEEIAETASSGVVLRATATEVLAE